MKSSTITLAVTLALSSSSSVSTSQNDNKDDNDDQAEDDDCEDDESSDSEDAVHDPTEQYYKIGSNSSTGVRIPKSSSTQSNSNKPPPAQAPALVKEKKQDYQKSKTTEQPNYEKPETSKQPSYEKPETSKQWSQPPVDPVKVQKTYSHKDHRPHKAPAILQAISIMAKAEEDPEPVGSHSGYSGKATLFVALDHDLDLDNSLSKNLRSFTQDGNAGACGKPTKTVITSSPFKWNVWWTFAARLSLLHAYRCAWYPSI
ncbi:hypothetical protein KEM48_007379 [Puccinia striiformis f. sp. tritici PST-130]|nr:hypothetical protein KEM48_007379 [Puccinia striiformis f. sp. tritici PST-130]